VASYRTCQSRRREVRFVEQETLALRPLAQPLRAVCRAPRRAEQTYCEQQ
jgi:hypothetical protein